VYFHDLEQPTSGRHLVEDNTFSLSRYVGIYLNGSGSEIRRNRVLDTTGHAGSGAAFAIVAYGAVDIVDNLVREVEAHDAAAAGILVNENLGGSVRGNRVSQLAVTSGTGPIVGIRAQNSSSRVIFRGNVVSGDGVAGSVGLSCDNPNQVAKSNSISGFDSALECTDNGNLIKP
jgi:parallel beta-helix repeat protein